MPEPGLSKPLRPAHFGPMGLMTMSPLAAVDPQVEVEAEVEASIPSADSSSKKASTLDSLTDNIRLHFVS